MGYFLDNGFAFQNKERERREDIRTSSAELNQFVSDFRAWCMSNEAMILSEQLAAAWPVAAPSPAP